MSSDEGRGSEGRRGQIVGKGEGQKGQGEGIERTVGSEAGFIFGPLLLTTVVSGVLST